jgi:hypothetical protein
VTQANASIDFVKTVFPSTEQPVHFCSLGNERDGKHPFRKLDTRDPAELSAFIAKMDQPERGLFYCVSTLKLGAKARNKENAVELAFLFADIDLKDVDESIEDIERKLGMLRHRPALTIRSGNGVHAIWPLTEPVMVQEEGQMERVEAALRQLADIVGGDLQVCEVARLMRLPGTHNTKNGEWKDVVVSTRMQAEYDLSDLEEWFGEQSPVILRKERPRANTAKQNAEEDPYLAWAKEKGVKTPIDVQARLDGMMFMGGGDAAVHATQLAVSSSLLNSGTPIEEVVEILLQATKAAAGDYGKRWNWRIEERSIRKMCETWATKFTPTGSKPAANSGANVRSEENSGANLITSSSGESGSSNVVSLAAARKEKPKPAPVSDQDANHIKIGGAVIDVLKKRGDDLIFTSKAAWHCSGGLWTMATDGMASWLNVEIERAIVSMGYASASKLVNETRLWIQRRPELWRDDVPWDQHGMVPTLSGLVNPRTLEVVPLRADHYATWRIETPFDPAAACPWWLQMLEDCFDDREGEERAATIAVIQELLGAGLIDAKPRSLSRALIFLGGSNAGKSGLLEVLGGLFGADHNSASLESLEGSHGMMPFTKRQPWVLHEAFDQRKWHFSSAVKAIVTGEPVAVNVKNGPMLSVRVRAPIFWGTNHPPQFKEATKAIVNRMTIIHCRREFIEEAPVGAAVEAAKKGMDKPSTLVLAEEKPGLLKWALDGLARALERGFLALTKEMKDASDDIRRDSNLVAGFLEECVEYDPERRLSTPDFCLAFATWWRQNKGEDRNCPSNETVGKALISMADPMIAINPKELRDMHRRYYAGIVLNEEGLAFHRAGHEMHDLQGKTANTTDPKGQVNSAIPAEWLKKPSVRLMHDRQLKGMKTGSVMSVMSVMQNGTQEPFSPDSMTDMTDHDRGGFSQLSYEQVLVSKGVTKF